MSSHRSGAQGRWSDDPQRNRETLHPLVSVPTVPAADRDATGQSLTTLGNKLLIVLTTQVELTKTPGWGTAQDH
jgi:hypothetical protein